MMLILRKKNHSSSSFLCFLTRSSTFLHLSSSSTKNSPPKASFITEYLISSCGFSLERATTISQHIARLNSPDRPNSVRHFLKHQGFADAQIRTIISRFPRILCTNADRTIGPNLSAIRDMGFAERELQKLILSNPTALVRRSAISRFEFWRNFLGGNTERLTLAFRRNLGLVNYDIDRRIRPRIALLKNCGLSEADIRTLLLKGQGIMRKSCSSIELLFKMEIYKSFGWSQEEFVSALLKNPNILGLSEENIQAKMEFLVERAGYTQKYVAGCPTILCYSLERRLIPRHQAMEILKSKELIKKKSSLYSVMCFPEKKFLERIILPHKDEVPMLLETYLAATGGKNQL